jgi:uncharacterized protein
VKAFSFIAAGLLAFASIARADDLPPINDPPTSVSLPGKFVWADLFTTDPAAAEKFYTALFGWQATSIAREKHPYILLSNNGVPIAGITLGPRHLDKGPGGRWVGYVSVQDVAGTATAFTASGGKIIFPARDVANRGTLAIVADQEGVVFGLLHSSSGDPEDYLPEPGEWAWAQLFARDSAAAALRYHSLLGYDAVPDTRSDRENVFVLASGGYARAGLAPLPARPDASPGWLGFVRVANVDQSASQAESLGGQILVAPKPGKIATRVAIVADPTGAAIGLIELNDTADLKVVP